MGKIRSRVAPHAILARSKDRSLSQEPCDGFYWNRRFKNDYLHLEKIVMFRIRIAAVAALVSIAVAGITAPVAMAQSSDAAASTPKEIQKAQRKAERKAARAKKNAELKTLEQNGYNPAGDQVNYPQNIQDAEKKAAAAKAASAQ
jgi:hypothetical protein